MVILVVHLFHLMTVSSSRSVDYVIQALGPSYIDYRPPTATQFTFSIILLKAIRVGVRGWIWLARLEPP